MLKNYLKLAWRNLKKGKVYSFINIIGLTIGLTAFLLIGLYIMYEMSFDSYHQNSDRIYNITVQYPEGSFLGGPPRTSTPAPLNTMLEEEVPGVETATLVEKANLLFIKDTFSTYETGVGADEDFFNVFTHEWLLGEPSKALSDPESIVLTKSLAAKLFPNQSPVGKTIKVKVRDWLDAQQKTVTGVIADVPANSHFTFDYVYSLRSDKYFRNYLTSSSGWLNSNYFTYLRLSSDVSIHRVVNTVNNLVQKKVGDITYYAEDPDGRIPSYGLMSLKDVRLYSSFVPHPIAPQNDIKTLYIFGAIGIIILLLACVNYMNLATARSIKRAKEVGIRKVVGAIRSQLIFQFIAESVILSLFSIALSLVAVQFLLPYFSVFADYEIPSSFLYNGSVIGSIVGIGLLVGILSGCYPAFYISSLTPQKALKEVFKGSRLNTRFRYILVIGQFVVTISLLIISTVIFKQIDLIQTKDLGYDKEQIVAISVKDDEVKNRYELVKQEVIGSPDISHFTSADNLPIEIGQRTTGIEWEGKEVEQEFSIYASRVNYDYTETFNFEMVAGRSFDEELDAGGVKYILNETSVREMGWTPTSAIGKSISLWDEEGEIVGVLKDFHFRSLHEQIKPIVLKLAPHSRSQDFYFARVEPNGITAALAELREVWGNFSLEHPFEYFFLDDEYNQMYAADFRSGSLMNTFTVLALIIACLGLFGLVAFFTEQRTKEIGVRKVLGASVSNIVSLFWGDISRLVFMSFCISIPFGWYIGNQWLKDFAYKIEINSGIFLFAGGTTLLIAILTVSWQSIRAALANPIESLRSE